MNEQPPHALPHRQRHYECIYVGTYGRRARHAATCNISRPSDFERAAGVRAEQREVCVPESVHTSPRALLRADDQCPQQTSFDACCARLAHVFCAKQARPRMVVPCSLQAVAVAAPTRRSCTRETSRCGPMRQPRRSIASCCWRCLRQSLHRSPQPEERTARAARGLQPFARSAWTQRRSLKNAQTRAHADRLGQLDKQTNKAGRQIERLTDHWTD
eukprot:6189504-Pleurochrysis_carterae.AAC.1